MKNSLGRPCSSPGSDAPHVQIVLISDPASVLTRSMSYFLSTIKPQKIIIKEKKPVEVKLLGHFLFLKSQLMIENGRLTHATL